MIARKTCLTAVLCALALGVSGCGYVRMVYDTWQTEYRHSSSPAQANVRRLAPESCLVVYGLVKADSGLRLPMLVAAVSEQYGRPEVVDAQEIGAPGYYTLYLPGGGYRIFAFGDLNRDSVFGQNECIGRYADGAEIAVRSEQGFRTVQSDVHVPVDTLAPSSVAFEFSVKRARGKAAPTVSRYYPPGAIRSLDDEIFSPRYGELGLYDPAAFLSVAGLYFYAIRERDMRKTPVVFVHGIGGSPREFRYIVEHIDLDRFDPWFFYYPGGKALDKTADVFYELFFSGRVIDLRHRSVVIVAHSMGGLVVREAVNRYLDDKTGNSVKLWVSMATPYGGDDMATSGVEKAPVIVPSWRDMASNSTFIGNLHRNEVPPEMNFHLFFAYQDRGTVKLGENKDESVSLKSQLDPRAQCAAVSVRGFNETHTGILESADVLGQLNLLLSRVH